MFPQNFTQLGKILQDRRSRRSWQISSLDEEESSGEEDDGPGLLALNGNIADLENEEEDRDYDETGHHEDDDVKDEEG